MDSTIKPTKTIQLTSNPFREYPQIGFKVKSIQRWIQPLNPQIRFQINSIQRRIQSLKLQIGLNVNSIQRRIQPLN